MVGEEHHVGVAVHAHPGERRADAPDVEVQILDHGVVAGQIEARPLFDAGGKRYVAPQFEVGGVNAACSIGGVGTGAPELMVSRWAKGFGFSTE